MGLGTVERMNFRQEEAWEKKAASILIDAVQKLSLCRKLDDVTAIVRAAARRIVNADGATFVLAKGDRCFYADEDAISPLWKGQQFPMETCISGWSMLNRLQVAIPDIYKDERIPHDAYRPTFVKSLVMTPIRVDDPIAAIGTYWAAERQPAENEMKFLQMLADTTAVAMENIRAFSELEEHKNRLEELVAERTNELKKVNEELALARDKAIEASALKSAFVANVSHELRTPLSGIIGLSELMLLTDMSEKQKALAETVYGSAHSLLAIINDILDISKIEAGKLTVETVPFNLMFVVQECSRVLFAGAEEKHLRLMTHIDQSMPEMVIGDAQRIRQVLLNLIGNAIKFTDRGEVAVSAIVDKKEQDKVVVRFVVEDTGPGFSEDARSLLFQRFSQLARSERGTGLGLAISKGLVELMGGTLGVDSVPGEGSRFWFCIPFAISGSGRPERRAKPRRMPQRCYAGKTAFVIEDNAVMQKLVDRQLKEFGFEVRVSGRGREAIEVLKQNRFDVVFMDCNLPDVSGFDATRMIREHEREMGRERATIIAMTAMTMSGDEESCLNSGMDDYLSKPFTMDDLEQKLNRWVPIAEAKAESN